MMYFNIFLIVSFLFNRHDFAILLWAAICKIGLYVNAIQARLRSPVRIFAALHVIWSLRRSLRKGELGPVTYICLVVFDLLRLKYIWNIHLAPFLRDRTQMYFAIDIVLNIVNRKDIKPKMRRCFQGRNRMQIVSLIERKLAGKRFIEEPINLTSSSLSLLV